MLIKNELNGTGVWAVLLQIDIPGSETIYLSSDGVNTSWNSQTWIAFPFDFQEINITSKGDVPSWQINVSNINGIIGVYASQYDAYIKANGIDGNIITCKCFIVNTNDLSNLTPVYSEYFQLTSIKADNKNVTFTLGGSNPFTSIFPKRRGLKNFCTFKFQSVECGYAGLQTTCDKTLSTCRIYGNDTRFGGFPGAGDGGVRLA